MTIALGHIARLTGPHSVRSSIRVARQLVKDEILRSEYRTITQPGFYRLPLGSTKCRHRLKNKKRSQKRPLHIQENVALGSGTLRIPETFENVLETRNQVAKLKRTR